MKRKKPIISVIIPTLEEEKRIAPLIRMLHAQTIRTEIIVVDGGSTDRTVIRARQDGARVLESERGVALQRNHGAKHAQADIICFLDADVTVSEDFLGDCLAQMERRNLEIACPRYWPYGSTPIIKVLHWCYNLTFWLMQKIVPSGGGSCIIVRRKAFEASRGFDITVKFEDMHFLRQARRFGRFGFLSSTIGVSDRRFRREGTLRTALLYAGISVLFLLNLYRLTRFVRYNFAHYEK